MKKLFLRLGICLVIVGAVLVGMTLLPHSPYIRWQAVKVEAFARLGWIFERIHYDDTPIDIAFIGTSHTMMGIDAEDLEKRLAADGFRSQDSRCIHAVNLAIPSYGRDLHWLIVRELLENRKVKVLVLEVFENETRKAHPLFVHVADVKDVIEAPILVNINYLHNLIRLPYRQLSLWFKDFFSVSFSLKNHFDPADYDGSNVDNTRIVNVGGAALSPYRDHVMERDRLEAAAKAMRDKKNLHMLGKWAESYEYAVPDHYVTALLDLAREKGTDVVFLYLPQYGMPEKPADFSLYEGRGDWIYVNDALRHPEYWFEEVHLNAQGASQVTRRVAEEFAARWKSSQGALDKDEAVMNNDALQCSDHVYAARTTLTPFEPSEKSASMDEIQ
jgi:hypothetical protein